jgi:peptidyl-prolyl cis-trans isomerase C
MKCAIRLSTTLFAVFIAGVCPFTAVAAGAASTPAVAYSLQTPPSAIVATVNGRPITQADLDNAVAASGNRDTAALRLAVKHRLIALELLRQAAAKFNYTHARLATQQAPETDRERVAIQLYLHDAVRPAPVADADVRARYRQMVRSLRAAAPTPISGLGALQGSIRKQLETERFDEAVRAVVENLMANANISE